jgi:hypothetical protein
LGIGLTGRWFGAGTLIDSLNGLNSNNTLRSSMTSQLHRSATHKICTRATYTIILTNGTGSVSSGVPASHTVTIDYLAPAPTAAFKVSIANAAGPRPHDVQPRTRRSRPAPWLTSCCTAHTTFVNPGTPPAYARPRKKSHSQ